MSFYHLPHPWNPGYALPEYVQAEPPERGTFTTQWLPRGTISSVVPDYLAVPGRKLLGRADAQLSGLGTTLLGDLVASPLLLVGVAAAGYFLFFNKKKASPRHRLPGAKSPRNRLRSNPRRRRARARRRR